ncbi:hypothetical protein PSACC_02603 [Paramicrosporidium saccamoebae]|uniref:Oxysterol-binding protein n=1 Tax=Paramicrosporidium saccamoebae TaxID=1246581 RepID=A0A2H9TIG6_9FUNG|nr:hypothetical protein PSACC_02603 [Paramicrosporidium saccamoebae]
MSRRENRLLNALYYVHNTYYRSVFGKVADSLERSNDAADEYMIIDLKPVTAKYISVPKELSQFCCSAFVAGMIEAVLTAMDFPAKVSAHTQPQEGYPSRTVFLIKFSAELQSNSEANLHRSNDDGRLLTRRYKAATNIMTVESMTNRNDVSTAAAKLDTLAISSPLTEERAGRRAKEHHSWNAFPSDKGDGFAPDYIPNICSGASFNARENYRLYVSPTAPPQGVKKPYNPVLGEFFRCRWKCDDGSSSFYIAEQVSHHPPISAYFYANPENYIVGMGNFKPKGKFLGNSVMSQMQGTSHIYFTNRPGEEYVISNPNVYARGIMFGTMLMELGDVACITCEKNDLVAEIEFKVKGYFSGTYNSISGKIKRISTGEVLYDLSGKWTDTLYISSPQNASASTETLFHVPSCQIVPKLVAPIERQDPYESRRLWKKVSVALQAQDFDAASAEKTHVEDDQRAITKLREDGNLEWRPKFFRRGRDDFWYFVDRDALKQTPCELNSELNDFFLKHYGLGARFPDRPSK